MTVVPQLKSFGWVSSCLYSYSTELIELIDIDWSFFFMFQGCFAMLMFLYFRLSSIHAELAQLGQATCPPAFTSSPWLKRPPCPLPALSLWHLLAVYTWNTSWGSFQGLCAATGHITVALSCPQPQLKSWEAAEPGSWRTSQVSKSPHSAHGRPLRCGPNMGSSSMEVSNKYHKIWSKS